MSDYNYLPASNGSGDPVLMHIQTNRSIGSATIDVDSVTNVATDFLGTTGTLTATGILDTTKPITNVKCHISGSDIIIDSFEPGSSDAGNLSGEVLIVKPTVGWFNRVAQFIMNLTNQGTPEAWTVHDLTANAITASSITLSSGVLLDGVTSATYQYSITGTDLTNGYIFVSFAHGLSYTPRVEGRFFTNATSTAARPLPFMLISNKSYSAIPQSVTIDILNVDATNINVGMAIHDITGASFFSTNTTIKFQFLCVPFNNVD